MRTKVWKEARRVLAIFMEFAMVVINFSSIPVSADEGGSTTSTTYTFDATTLTATADKEQIADGTELATNFTSVGTVTKRLKNTEDATQGVKSVEIGKNVSGAIAFAVTGTVNGNINICNPGCCKKTFPEYFEVLDSITK